MLRPWRITSAFVLALGLLPSTAAATPLLQIGIGGGWYDEVLEDTVATAASFTLYAYLTPATNITAAQLEALLNDTYYIAAGLSPRVSQAASLGSFSYNNSTINATTDMVYGTPPFEPLDPGTQDSDSGDLAAHGIYATYFKEFSFKFKSGPSTAPKNCGVNVNCTDVVNVEEVEGTTPTPNANGGMYYMAFQVDTTKLNTNYVLNFDLYSESFKNCNANHDNPGCDIDIKKFAPFSHNARSFALPEPSSLALLGAGAVGMAFRYRRRFRR